METRNRFPPCSTFGKWRLHKLDTRFSLILDEETGAHIKLDFGFQFMYHLGTGVHLNYDAGFHFIRAHRGAKVWYGSSMSYGVGDGCLECQKGSFWLFNEGFYMSDDDVLIAVPTMGSRWDDRRSLTN